jgi:hypothetical protein
VKNEARYRISCVASLALCACSTTTAMSSPIAPADLTTLNNDLRGQEVELRFTRANPDVARSSAVSVDASKVLWTDQSGGRQSVPVDALQSLSYVSGPRGAGDGFGLGFLSGAIAGGLLGFSSGDDPSCGTEVYFCIHGSRGEKAVVGAVLLGLVGGIVGAIIGANEGHHRIVRFISQVPATSSHAPPTP